MDEQRMPQMSIHSVCRICVEVLKKENYDIFKVPGLAKKFVCTPLTIEENDGFSKNICAECYKTLNSLHAFHKLCLESVDKFQELLSKNVFMREYDFDNLDDNDDNLPPLNSEIEEELTFDPLLPKMELIEDEEAVVEMLEKVEQVIEDESKDEQLNENNLKKSEKENESNTVWVNELNKEPIEIKNDDSDNNSEDDDVFNDGDDIDKDSDFREEDDEGNNCNIDSDDSDDIPLAKRRTRKTKKTEDNEASTSDSKSKRKRIPESEKHLHKRFKCDICQSQFHKNERYQEHMKYHNEKQPFKCEVEGCLRGFTTANGLRLHVEIKHTESTEEYTCPELGCGKTFDRARTYHLHLKKVAFVF